MLRIAIIGCGKIADDHASQIQRISDCKIVGVCDRELLMAKQLSERFPIEGFYSDVEEMLRLARPDVVHITTPPQSHFKLAKLCLESGCHVYVEKPFTVTYEEARELIAIARDRGLKITAGHDDQYAPVALRMREVVQTGYLGGTAVHMESTFCYDLSDPSYARALLGDSKHWVRGLPGMLLQNIISHGLARIAEFLTTEDPQVIAYGFVSPLLKSLGETEMVDELRVIISEDERTTAYFTFSSQMRPSLHEFRVYGPKNGLIVDQDHEILIKLRGDKFKSYADKFLPPLLFAKQFVNNFTGNVRKFLHRKFHFKAGMKNLIEALYVSVRTNGPEPIPYREILVTARIMDLIFDQLAANRAARLQTAPSHESAQLLPHLK